MKISYEKLWRLLKERKITKTKLCQMTGISTSTLHKMKYCEAVNTDSLIKICMALNCDIFDIARLVNDTENPTDFSKATDIPFDYNPLTDTLSYCRPDRKDGITKLVIANYLDYLPHSAIIHPDYIEAFSNMLKFAGQVPTVGKLECLANVDGTGFEMRKIDYKSYVNDDGVVYKVVAKAR